MKTVSALLAITLVVTPTLAYTDCGWKQPSKMFQVDHPSLDTSDGAYLKFTSTTHHGNDNDEVEVTLKNMDRKHFQYRVTRFDARGKTPIVTYENPYANCQFNNDYDLTWNSVDTGSSNNPQYGYTSACSTSDDIVIDKFFAGNKNSSLMFDGSNPSGDTNDLSTVDHNDNAATNNELENRPDIPIREQIPGQSIFDGDYSIVDEDTVTTSVVYLLEARSRKCRVSSSNFGDQTLVRAHLQVDITFKFTIVDEAVYGAAYMTAGSDASRLVFVRAADEDLGTKEITVQAHKMHNNIAMSGSISFDSGLHNEDRVCVSLAPGNTDANYTQESGDSDSLRLRNTTIESSSEHTGCKITARVITSKGPGNNPDHEFDDSNQNSLDDTAHPLLEQIDDDDQNTLREDEVVTFLSLAQYSLMGQTIIRHTQIRIVPIGSILVL